MRLPPHPLLQQAPAQTLQLPAGRALTLPETPALDWAPATARTPRVTLPEAACMPLRR